MGDSISSESDVDVKSKNYRQDTFLKYFEPNPILKVKPTIKLLYDLNIKYYELTHSASRSR